MGPKKNPRCEVPASTQQEEGALHNNSSNGWSLCSDVVGIVAAFIAPLANAQTTLMLVNRVWLVGVTQQDAMKPKPGIFWPYSSLTSRGNKKLRLSVFGKDHHVLELARVAPTVQEITIESNKRLTDAAFDCFDHLMDLKSLVLTSVPHITVNGFRKICHAENIKHLKVHNCPNFDDNVLQQVKALSKLEYLAIRDAAITDFALALYVPQMEHLKYLSFTDSRSVGPAGFMTIGRLKHLEALDLGRCCGITDSVMVMIGDELQNLTELNLACCTNVTDRGAQLLTKLSKLTRLNLSRMAISPDVLQGIIAANPNITHLLLEFCGAVRNDTFEHIEEKLPRLSHLSVMGCVELDDAGLEPLKALKETLVFLDVSQNQYITTDGIAKIIPTLGALTHLNISQCLVDDQASALIGQLKHLSHLLCFGVKFSARGLENLPKAATVGMMTKMVV